MKVLISTEDVSKRINELGSEISRYYSGRQFTAIVVLKGSFIFAADLLRAVEPNDFGIEFIRLSSYRGTSSSGKVEMFMGELEKFRGKDVLVIEDIVDTGLTLTFFNEKLREIGANSVKICSLLEKPEINKGRVKIDFLGFPIPDKFVVGCGLDHNEKYRNLPFIAVLDE